MKIALDSGPLSDGNAGRGVGVYTKLLVESLSKYVQKKGGTLDVLDIHAQNDLSNYDVIHYPYFDFFTPTLKIPSSIPVVVTVHDTIPLIYPKHYPAGVKGGISLFRQKRALRKAKAVITDSNTSKKDIVRFLGITDSIVYPVYLGPTVSEKDPTNFAKQVLSKYKINYPYVIYIGDVNWNKNLVNLSKACESSKIHLIIVGKKAVSDNYDEDHIENWPLRDLQKEFKQSNFIHRIGFVSDEDLPILIRQAIILCQPSFYEGFGLSVLDAMSLGIPTVCAKTQTLVELYESASVFFDPYDVSHISKTLVSVFTNSALQKEVSKKGIVLSHHFSWQKTAQETYSVYETLF